MVRPCTSGCSSLCWRGDKGRPNTGRACLRVRPSELDYRRSPQPALGRFPTREKSVLEGPSLLRQGCLPNSTLSERVSSRRVALLIPRGARPEQPSPVPEGHQRGVSRDTVVCVQALVRSAWLGVLTDPTVPAPRPSALLRWSSEHSRGYFLSLGRIKLVSGESQLGLSHQCDGLVGLRVT